MQSAAEGPGEVDALTAGRQARRALHLRNRKRQHDPAQPKKNETKPWLVGRFCIPPDKNAAFVLAMEDVLEVYHRPYDPARPQVCLDETSKQLLEHTRTPLAASPGMPARIDDEYSDVEPPSAFAKKMEIGPLPLQLGKRAGIRCA